MFQKALLPQITHFEKERVFVQNHGREYDMVVCSVASGHMPSPGLEGSHPLLFCPYFPSLSPTWDWRGGKRDAG